MDASKPSGTVRFTIEGVAELLRVPTRTIERWVQDSVGPRPRRGVLGQREQTKLFSFIELIELLYVRELIRPCSGAKGFSIAEVAQVVESLSQVLGPHPLARANLGVSGRQVIADGTVSAATVTNGRLLQHILDFERDYISQVVVFQDGEPTSWSPAEGILVSPTHRFGQPVTSKSKIPTHWIRQRYEADGRDLGAAAEWFGTTIDEVRTAVQYEEDSSHRTAA